MNLDSLSFVLSQISYLATSLTKKNYKANVSECNSLVSQFGPEAERHLFRCLFSQVDFIHENKPPLSLQLQFLLQKIEDLLKKAHFVSVLCYCIDSPLHHQKTLRATPQLISNITKNLRLTPLKELALVLALTNSSNRETKKLAENFFKAKFPEFARNLSSNNETKTPLLGEVEAFPDLLSIIISALYEVQEFQQLKEEYSENLVTCLRKHYPPGKAPLALLPHLSLEEKDPDPEVLRSLVSVISDRMAGKSHIDEGRIPDVIMEVGYQFTASNEQCRNTLLRLCGTEIHAQMVARIIGIMIRTHTGLDDSTTLQNMSPTGTSLWEKNEPKTWNIEVFIKAVHELQPTLHWKEIIYELDHPRFVVKDRQGLVLLLNALKLGLQAQGFQGAFPVELFYRHWKNTEGQISFFQQCLRNPDIFSFVEHNHHSAAVEVLKVPPDLESREVASWRSLELVESLLYLAEAGHTQIVMDLFNFPKNRCPDVLALSLLQISPPVTPLRGELLAMLFQIFLANHQNSLVILAHAWHMQTINFKVVVIHAMADWYEKATQEGDCEHSRLSRILDVAQDLKALSLMLNVKPMRFVIDLAVLASRREYLKLEKWLTDQMREHGESSVKAVVQYLSRKIPVILGPGPLKEEHVTKSNFPMEALPIILMCLQGVVASTVPIQPDLRETIINMVQNSQALLNRPRPQPLVPSSGVLRPPSRTMDSSAFTGSGPSAASSAITAVAASTAAAVAAPIRPTPRLPPNSMFHDQLTGLTNQFSTGLNLNSGSGAPGMPPVSSSAFSLPNVLGSLVPGPGSPSRMFGNPPTSTGVDGGTSPFLPQPLLPPPPQQSQQQQQQHVLPGAAAAATAVAAGSSSTTASTTSASVAAAAAAAAGSTGMQSGIELIRQGNISSLFPEMTGPVSRDVEDEANSYFQRIYSQPCPTLSIDEVLELLKKFQESSVQRERDVFNCMIKNLFEEYKYFPQYPDEELHTTAQLFGGIIEHGLVTMIPLGLALRFVLEAVRKPTDSNMYYFGIAALDRFKTRLKDYPQYCQHVSCIPHFKEFPPHLIEWVEFGAQSQVPSGKPQAPEGSLKPPSTRQPQQPEQVMSSLQVAKSTVTVTMTTSTSSKIVRATVSTIGVGGRPSIANTTNIDTLLNARQSQSQIQIPSDKIQDKVAFIFNNLSLMNMQQKAADLKEQLDGDNYLGWLAQYLVMKRASIEPNFHSLYSNFLEVLNNPKLYDEVLKETYQNIRILLRSDKGVANYSDRSLLKNLGHWLGLMTLARNRPILMVDLDIKPLIIEAYHKGQQELLYMVPFVAKVVESCAKSKVFKPPCPWTMGIMNLLAELHQEQDLKLNLKFEIEVLCKTLSISLAELKPGNLLKDYDKLNKILNVKNFGLPQHQQQHHGNMVALGKQGSGGGGGLDSTISMASVTTAVAAAAAVSGHKLDPSAMMQHAAAAAANMPGMHPVTSVHQPGAAGAGMGAALVATPLVHNNFNMGGANAMASLMQSQSQQRFNETQQESLTAPPPHSSDSMSAAAQEQAAAAHAAAAAAAAQVSQGPPATLLRQSEPKFHYTDINTSNLNGIVPHISVDGRLSLLKDRPDFVQLIKLAIEKSIQEWASPVIDRAIEIALTTCEQIVKKDCALDHDENHMRQAAHHMVRNLTAGMAMITCRDHLLLSIKTNLRNFMITLGRNLTANQTEAIEMTVNVIANDNVELACAFIQKKAIEKVIPEIDKRLKNEYDNRILARKEGRRYYDPVALTYQAERVPEMIRLKVGTVTPDQSAVYEDFARNIPGFKPLTEREAMSIAPKPLVDVHQPPTAAVASVSAAQAQRVAAVVAAQAAAAAQAQQAAAAAVVPSAAAAAATAVVASVQQPPIAIAPSDDCIAILDEVYSKLDPFVTTCTGLPATPHMTNLHALVEAVSRARTSKDVGSILILIQKAVEALLEGLTPNFRVETENLARYRDANLLVLRALSDPRAFGNNWTSHKVTLALTEVRDDVKYNLDAVDILIRSGLVSLLDYDKYLAMAMQTGDDSSIAVINFAMHLCKIYLIDDRSNANIIESDLFGTIEVLQKISTNSAHPPEGIISLMEMIKMSSERLEQNLAMSGPTGQLHSGIQQAGEFEDPPGLLEKTEFLLREWVNAYHSREAGKDSRQAFGGFVQRMNQHGILKTDDLITRFFRMSTQMCVDLCYRALAEQNNSPTLVRAKCFHTLDAYVRLITLLVKHSGETQNTVTKVNLLNKVLGIVAGVLLIDHDVRNTDFQQVPYHRIFIMLFLELNSPDTILVSINFQVLMAYSNMLHLLCPSKAPGFAYAWLEIVSHRVFMQQVLANSQPTKTWPMYAQLLVDLFKFLSPFLRNAELAKPVYQLYRGTLRVLLVLLHDFPEFLCDYHYSFCDVIPPNCIQMRNLILSAFPRNMRLPDPFTPNLKVDMLPDIAIAPRAVTNYSALLKPIFKKELDSYLKNRTPVSFLTEVRSNLSITNGDGTPATSNRYNIQMINALVMHVGTSAIQHIRNKGQTPNMSTIAHSSHMDIFQNLAVDLETEGRYLFLNCIANQLRYPNSHTHYFSCTLLYLFAEANTESIQEQITRVLLERLIVNRPHPWGLLITFIELIKNPSFKFWSHEFVHCAPEIQKLFESVARSCMVPSLPRESVDNK